MCHLAARWRRKVQGRRPEGKGIPRIEECEQKIKKEKETERSVNLHVAFM